MMEPGTDTEKSAGGSVHVRPLQISLSVSLGLYRYFSQLRHTVLQFDECDCGLVCLPSTRKCNFMRQQKLIFCYGGKLSEAPTTKPKNKHGNVFI